MAELTRRALLRAGLAAGGTAVATGCGRRDDKPRFVAADSPQVRSAEEGRRRGPVREFRLTAAPGPVDLGGRTWPARRRAHAAAPVTDPVPS